MEAVANNYLRDGDVASAAHLYTSLETLNPKYNAMARICRVLADPISVPLPHRHNDVCEAILSPHIPADILLGGAATAESIHKQYQRFAVHVHPDKNPNPRAGECFQRLTTMRDEALRTIDIQQKVKAAAAADNRAFAADGKARRKKKGGAAEAMTSPSASPARTLMGQHRSPLSKDLSALKQTRITLKSLKRKDIDDDFEIFATTGTSSPDGGASDSAEVERQLAATAPSRTIRALGARPPPKKAAGVKSRPPPPLRPGGSAPPATQAPLVFVPSAQGPLEGPPPPVGVGSSPRPQPATDEAVVVEEVDEIQAIRNEVDGIIAGLASQRTRIRLSCDLSFEAYQRDKTDAS